MSDRLPIPGGEIEHLGGDSYMVHISELSDSCYLHPEGVGVAMWKMASHNALLREVGSDALIAVADTLCERINELYDMADKHSHPVRGKSERTLGRIAEAARTESMLRKE